MKSSSPTRLAMMIVAIAIAGLAATWAVGKVMSYYEQASKDSEASARVTDKMKTVCVGRFLVDMPNNAQVDLGSATIDGIDLAAFKETEEEFHQRLADREAQISTLTDRLGGNKNLESVITVSTDTGLVGKVFVHSRTVREGTQGNGLGVERYRYEGVTIEALVHGKGVSVDLDSKDREPAWIDDVPELVKKLVVNPENRIPDEAGFCLDHAYVRDPLTAEQKEKITMSADMPNHPDVQFLLIVAAGLKPDEEGLIERSHGALRLRPFADRMRIRGLRAAPRNIGGLTGDELVESISEGDNITVQSFWWEVNGTRHDVANPHVALKMITGSGPHGPVPPSVSEGTAVALWDRVVPTFRLLAKEPHLSAGSRRGAVTRASRSDMRARARLVPAAQ